MSDLVTRLSELATRVGEESKSLRTLLNGNAADLSSLATTAKTSLVAALNELHSMLADVGASINDTATSSATETYSIDKIRAVVAQAITDLTNAAPTALDTLSELATALGDDANFSTTVANALALRVRVDAAQTFDTTQKAQGCANLGIGDPNTDLAAVFASALV